MTIEQVQAFVKESIDNRIRWDQVAVLGGEPTLHPDFREITDLAKQVAKRVLFVTNGITGIRTPEDIGHGMEGVKIKNTAKASRVHRFAAMTDAVCDSHPEISVEQYAEGCTIPSVCGLGMNAFGYYPCPIAGTVDRIFGMGLGIPTLKELLAADSRNVFRQVCRYCGHFWDTLGRKWDEAEEPTISPCWKVALSRFNSACRQ